MGPKMYMCRKGPKSKTVIEKQDFGDHTDRLINGLFCRMQQMGFNYLALLVFISMVVQFRPSGPVSWQILLIMKVFN